MPDRRSPQSPPNTAVAAASFTALMRRAAPARFTALMCRAATASFSALTRYAAALRFADLPNEVVRGSTLVLADDTGALDHRLDDLPEE